jgi:hypothetical protein
VKTNRRESVVKAAVHAYLSLRTDVFFWRANVSAGVAPSGIFVRSGEPGQGDFIGLQAPEGRFFGVETKRERGGKLSDDQIRWGANIVSHGGLYIVATSVGDVEKALGIVRAHVVKQRPMRVIHR